MGNCCDSREGNKGEAFIRKVLFFESEKFHHFKLINDLKYKIENDIIQNQNFIKFLNEFLKFKEEYQAKIVKDLFQKYFEKLNVLEINIYELSLLLIPYYKMSREEKRALFKLIIDYLSTPSSFICKPKSHKEIIFNYYYFHTIWTNKIFLHTLNQIHNSEKSSYTNSNLIDEIILLDKIFTEDNLNLEVKKAFICNELDGYECSDVSSFEAKNEKNRNTTVLKNIKGQINTYKRSNSSGSYKSQKFKNKMNSISPDCSPGKFSKLKKIDKSMRYNESKIIIDFEDIRENFINTYSKKNQNN